MSTEPKKTLSTILQDIVNGEDHISTYLSEYPTLPEECSTWLARLFSFKGVPFNYLIPDERMLPVESIRFFEIDDQWLQALFQGTYSIGRITDLDQKLDEHNYGNIWKTIVEKATGHKGNVFSGFLMRSQLVKSYPTMVYKAYDSTGAEMSKVRLEKISDSVMLGIFVGPKLAEAPHYRRINQLYIQEPQEGLHFGIDAWNSDSPPSEYPKTLKNLRGAVFNPTKNITPSADAGEPIKTGTPSKDLTIQFNFRSGDKQVLPIAAMATSMQSTIPTANQKSDGKFTAAEFALEMVEATKHYTFKIS